MKWILILWWGYSGANSMAPGPVSVSHSFTTAASCEAAGERWKKIAINGRFACLQVE